MASINLTQGSSGATKPVFFDKGFYAALILLIVALGIYGGLHIYVGSLEKKLESLNAEMQQKRLELQGKTVDRLADFENRSTYLGNNQVEKVDSTVLRSVESAVIPPVVLVKESYEAESHKVSLSAETGTYKSLAQQIQSLKEAKDFSNVEVMSINRTDSGDISFVLEFLYKTPESNKK